MQKKKKKKNIRKEKYRKFSKGIYKKFSQGKYRTLGSTHREMDKDKCGELSPPTSRHIIPAGNVPFAKRPTGPNMPMNSSMRGPRYFDLGPKTMEKKKEEGKKSFSKLFFFSRWAAQETAPPPTPTNTQKAETFRKFVDLHRLFTWEHL